jgi:outer membrane protein OmpA-like peptidoglycan-associated protein
MTRLVWGLVLLLWMSFTAAAQGPKETFKIVDLKSRIVDLQFRVTDLSGNPVEIGGRVEELQVRESATEFIIDMAADVLFDFDKADILPKAEEMLSKAAEMIRERAKGVVRIEGHTDSKGNDAYNLKLSQRRADSVRNWFVQRANLTNVQFQTVGRGELQPVAPNEKTDGSDDPEGRQKNRRVQIVVGKG